MASAPALTTSEQPSAEDAQRSSLLPENKEHLLGNLAQLFLT
jgi:hypothetical protein